MSTTFFKRLLSKKQEDETLRAYATRLGVPRSTMRAWSKGRCPSSPRTFVTLAHKLDVTAPWLAFGREAVPPDPSRLR